MDGHIHTYVPAPHAKADSSQAMIWERSVEAYYATVTAPDGDARFHLVVESDGDRWDWITWRPGQTEQEARHGHADTVQEAMREAEQAAG